jgi:hypothetical protein
VFISVTAWPFFTLIVAAPFSYEPPAIPIFAALLVRETSVNTGAAAGNERPTLTVLATPLTEIVARVTFAAGAFEPPVNRLEDGVLPELRFGLEAGFGAADGVSEAQVEAPVAVVTPPQSEICW